MILLLTISLATITSFIFVGLLVKYAIRSRLVDVPNQRSSHHIPTPSAGGLGVLATVLIGWVMFYFFDLIPESQFFGMFGASIIVSGLGLIDDLGHHSVRGRLIGHFLAAIWFLCWIDGLPPLILFGSLINFKWIGDGLAMFYLVWLLNLYNFMDGIDGMAGTEAFTSLVVISFLLFLIGEKSWNSSLLIAMSVLGFLAWNWPPAKIFLGDTGSCFIGMVLGMMSIVHAQIYPELFWCWIILLGVFITDSTLTLIRRIIRKQVFYEAHRSHAYQYASRRFQSHRTVTIGILIINLFWLSPIAVMVAFEIIEIVWALFISYIPLLGLALYFKAGASELQEV